MGDALAMAKAKANAAVLKGKELGGKAAAASKAAARAAAAKTKSAAKSAAAAAGDRLSRMARTTTATRRTGRQEARSPSPRPSRPGLRARRVRI